MDGSISTTQSWKKLWCEVPGAIIIAITKASASAAELSSDLGPVRQHLLLTQSMQVVSSLCVMINPLCTQISQASVSLIMMTGKGGIIEVQGTAEGPAFSRQELSALLDLAQYGIQLLTEQQKLALNKAPAPH
jgi:ribonuclease PH